MPPVEPLQGATSGITVADLGFSYPGSGEEALLGVSCSFTEGRTYAVLGRNGSGKSTLARCLSGLLVPGTGKVISFGLDTSEEKNRFEVRKRLGMVFQDPDTQMVGMTVEQEVAFGPENLGLEPSVIRGRVDRAMALAGVGHLRLRQPLRLSQGQKQLVAIAGALAMEPEFLVSDESTSMLDSVSRARVLDLFDSQKACGMGIIHVTHFLIEAARADQVLILDGGRLAAEGTPREVLADPARLERLGLEPLPATLVAKELVALCQSAPRGALKVEELLAWLRA